MPTTTASWSLRTEDVPEAEEDHAREAVKICPASVLRLE